MKFKSVTFISLGTISSLCGAATVCPWITNSYSITTTPTYISSENQNVCVKIVLKPCPVGTIYDENGGFLFTWGDASYKTGTGYAYKSYLHTLDKIYNPKPDPKYDAYDIREVELCHTYEALSSKKVMIEAWRFENDSDPGPDFSIDVQTAEVIIPKESSTPNCNPFCGGSNIKVVSTGGGYGYLLESPPYFTGMLATIKFYPDQGFSLVAVQDNGILVEPANPIITSIPLSSSPRKIEVEFEPTETIKANSIPKDFVAFSMNSLSLNDRSKCLSSGCKVGSFGKVIIGASVQINQAHAPVVWLRSNSIVDQVYANTIDAQAGATYAKVDNMDVSYSATEMRRPTLTNPKATNLTATQTTLSPGLHGSYTVNARSKLILKPGRYRFEDLRFESGSILETQPGSGSIEIYTRSFNFRGSIINPDASRLLVGVLSSEAIWIDTEFKGSVWAPDSKMTIGQSHMGPFEGSFFAKIIEVHQGSTLISKPYLNH